MSNNDSRPNIIKAGGKRFPVYLIVADNTDEFDIALRYAARVATINNARLAVLYVMPESDAFFLPWKQMNDRIDIESRVHAENFLADIGLRLSTYGLTPSLYLELGQPTDIIRDMVNKDKYITTLILAGDTSSGNPGPLVSYFTGRGLSEINVPVTVVPSHLDEQTFEHFFEDID